MWPLLEIAIEPKTPADRDKLTTALSELVGCDPTLRVVTDQESGQSVLGGADEANLDRAIEAVRQTYGVEALIGAPRVAYRETIGRSARITYAHKRRTGGSGEYAMVTILFEPAQPNSGHRFRNWIDTWVLPGALVAGVERGLLEARKDGLLAGFPVIDFDATLVDAKYHEVDSTTAAFEIAARGAFRHLRDEGGPLILEPIMSVEVATPEDYVGEVIGDLNARRGMIQETGEHGHVQVVIALAPLANMLDYAKALRSMSEGRADFIMRYDHYETARGAGRPDPDPDLFPPAAAMRA